MKHLKKTMIHTIISMIATITMVGPLFAQNDFHIIPESSTQVNIGNKVENIGSEGGKVWDKYRTESENLDGDVGAQLASGVMTWDTLLDYAVYLIRFISQVALVIGALMIIYAGYIYGTSVFNGGNASKGNDAIKKALTGVLIVIFSYAIMRIITSAFLT